MEKYNQEITTLSHLAGKAGTTNRSMRKRLNVASRLHEAGKAFLEEIHSECRGIGATADELEEERNKSLPALEKPELTVEYLRSIGREDVASW